MQQPIPESDSNLTADSGREGDKGRRDERVRTVVQSLRIIFGAIQAHSHWIEQQCGVSAVQLWAMRELSHAPGLKVTELALVLSVHPSNCSSMVDKLRKKGLVRKQRVGQDQRVVRLYITPKGQELLDATPLPVQGALVDALNGMPEAVLGSLDTNLAGVIKKMKAKDPGAALRPMAGA